MNIDEYVAVSLICTWVCICCACRYVYTVGLNKSGKGSREECSKGMGPLTTQEPRGDQGPWKRTNVSAGRWRQTVMAPAIIKPTV